jgi:hypothetical protein
VWFLVIFYLFVSMAKMSKIKNKYLFLILLLFAAKISFAQYSEVINSDRPGQSISANTVGARNLQMQMGGEYAQATLRNSDFQNGMHGGVVGLLVRYGIWRSFDLGFGFSHVTIDNIQSTRLNTRSSSTSFMLRGRVNFLEGNKRRPSLGMDVEVRFPDPQTERYTDFIAPTFTLILNQQIGERLTLASNIGARWSNTPTGTYTVNLGAYMSKRAKIFVEHYGEFFTQKFNSSTGRDAELIWSGRVNGGFAFVVYKDVQLDISAGYGGYENGRKDWYVGGGFSWRVHFKKREKSLTAKPG